MSVNDGDVTKRAKWIERNNRKDCCYWNKDQCVDECWGKLILSNPKESEPKQKWSINENDEIVSDHDSLRLCSNRNLKGTKKDAVGVLSQEKCNNSCTNWNFSEHSGNVKFNIS